MKRFGFLLILLVSILACQKDYNKIKSPYKFIPNETTSVLKLNAVNEFINSTKNHDILFGIYNKEIKTASRIIKHLNTTKPIYVSFLGEDQSDYLILAEKDSTLFVVDSIPNHLSETLVEFNVDRIQIDSTTFYHKALGKVFAASNSIDIIKNLNTENTNTELVKLLETTDDNAMASVAFKTVSPNYSKLLFSNVGANTSNYTVLDLNFSNRNLQYNGIITTSDSALNKIDCFKHTIPQSINSLTIAPYNTKSLLSITYNDFSVFNKNLHQLNNTEVDSIQTFLNFTNEIAQIDNAIILHSLDTDLVLETLEGKSNIETYRDIDIYELNGLDFFKSRLKPFIEFENAKYLSIYEDFIIFSNSTDTLKSIISNALNSNTIQNSDAFNSISENLSDEASLFIFKNSESLSNILEKNTKGYNANVVQYIYEDDYAHINGIIQKFKKRAASNTITEAFTTSLDTDIIIAPQTVKNHITNTHDIVVQDINNVLYLISNSGNILWKKQLQGKILGKVEQIDIYKNGRLQLAFATPSRLYVLDRNGNDVSPFPRKFNDKITQPLSVFDYDKRKNYRLLVTQGKNLLMYDAKGKSVSGFNYKNNGAEISTQPKHFRIGSKDYIAFAAGENFKILNRQGNVRINMKDKIRFSENELFLYKNKFTTTNTLGQLVQVDSKGRLNTKNLNLTDKHHLETTSKTLVTMTENKLNIKSRTIDLDYGDYTAPKIFYLNDKIYVTTTNLQTKKVYLFDSQAKSIPNFPVFGTSTAELQKLDKDKGLELITQADNKTIVVYKLH
ncbi:ribonuclease HII [Winogradskyella luteola]|uniref:Ribonuclease HII n=1 Tax=Winogradskyella luteola TaxID=2828330 RepID=A0A9X1FAK2_9FLAO|nr:ribonuclease HII [Winogradskyella luteola]MBV7270602.1 ribonuclease HII [Winogradskyella luteola]